MSKLSKLSQLINAETYYPECRRKSRVRIIIDHIVFGLKNKSFNYYYYVYGEDLQGKSSHTYIPYKTYTTKRDKLNLYHHDYNEVCLLRNKSLFSIIGKEYNFPVIQNIDLNINSLSVTELEMVLDKYKDLFIKPIDSICGEGTLSIRKTIGGEYLLNNKESYIGEIIESIPKSKCIVQKTLRNHHEIAKIYPSAINTLRIVTVNPKYSDNPKDVVLLGALLRMGAHGAVIDNWAKGGLVCGIDGDGKLMKFGFYKPGYGTKTEKHPDTHFKFEGFDVPYYKEALNLCKQFHSKLNKIHSIGWDVAITEEGPIFIEGNDDWELGFIQVCFGGIKKQFDTLFKEI